MAERQGTFAIDVREWCERAKANIETVVRATAVQILSNAVLRTPVGNPELWAANAEVMQARAKYNEEIQRSNSLLDEHPLLRHKYGLRKRRTLSAKTIAKRLPLKVGGKGSYTGGRMRGSWTVTLGAPSTREPGGIDPAGGSTIARGTEVIQSAEIGQPIFIISNVPYAYRIEYDGHSKQAPSGVVRVTAAEFQQYVNEQVRQLST